MAAAAKSELFFIWYDVVISLLIIIEGQFLVNFYVCGIFTMVCHILFQLLLKKPRWASGRTISFLVF